MKKLALISAIAISSLIYSKADAQVSIHVGFGWFPHRVIYRLVPPPPPEPVVVEQEPVYQDQSYQEPQYMDYDDSYDDDYYYLPDVDAYYNINAHCYYYNDGYNWVTTAYLPGRYRNYDWRSARRFEIHGNRPYMRNDYYRSQYNGRQIAEWRNFRHENHFGGAFRNNNDHFNRDAYRRNDNHFDNRGNWGRPQQNRGGDRFGDRGRGNWGQPNLNYNNNGGRDRGQGGFGQPQPNRYRGRGDFGQPNQNSGRGQGGFGQPNQNNGGGRDRGNNGGQPSNQNNGGGRDRGHNNNGRNDQFARNSQPMGMAHRGPTRF